MDFLHCYVSVIELAAAAQHWHLSLTDGGMASGDDEFERNSLPRGISGIPRSGSDDRVYQDWAESDVECSFSDIHARAAG